MTKADLQAEIADLKAALEARFAALESDLRWTKWIITGEVGLYVLGTPRSRATGHRMDTTTMTTTTC